MSSRFRIALILSLAVLCVQPACYSVEFRPAADYHAQRLSPAPPAGSVEILFQEPEGEYLRLGSADIRDVDNPRDPDFREFVTEEAERRGASGAWIRVSLRRSVPHGTFGSWFNPGDGIGIVPVIFFVRPQD